MEALSLDGIQPGHILTGATKPRIIEIMVRPQNREQGSCRKIRATLERLDRVDASVRFAFGDNAALASVSGPIEAKLGVELPEKAALEINLRPLSGVAGVTERLLCSALRGAFKPAILLNAHPRTLIQVVLQCLSPPLPKRTRNEGSQVTIFDTNPSMTAALINAGSLAFLQAASIPLIGTIIAVAVGMKRDAQENQLLIDPEDTEVQDLVGGGVFAFIFSRSHGELTSLGSERTANEDFTKGRVVWSSWDGVFDSKEYAKAEELSRSASAGILQTFRQIISETDEADSMVVD